MAPGDSAGLSATPPGDRGAYGLRRLSTDSVAPPTPGPPSRRSDRRSDPDDDPPTRAPPPRPRSPPARPVDDSTDAPTSSPPTAASRASARSLCSALRRPMNAQNSSKSTSPPPSASIFRKMTRASLALSSRPMRLDRGDRSLEHGAFGLSVPRPSRYLSTVWTRRSCSLLLSRALSRLSPRPKERTRGDRPWSARRSGDEFLKVDPPVV